MRSAESGLVGGGDSAERLQNLADNLPDGMIYQLVANGEQREFLYVSGGVETLFGVSEASALADAASLYRLIEPAFIPEMATAEAESLRTGAPFKVEVAVRHPNGSRRWLQFTSARRRRADGVAVWDGIALDVTDRKVAEAERERSQRRLDVATSAAAIGVWDWNPLTNEIVYSRRAKEICGLPLDQPVRFAQLTAVTHPDDLPETSAAARRATDPAIRSREIYRYRIIRADTGEVRWVLAHGEATFSKIEGREVATSYVGTLLDITEQKRADEALIESEARLRIAVEASEMAVWELDIANGTITPSPQLNKLYGLPPEARPTLADLRARYAPGEEERIEREGAEVRARGETQIQTEFRQIWPDGSEHWLLLRAAVAPTTAAGQGQRVIGVMLDITDRKLAEERMELVAREMQHRLKNSLAIVQTIAAQSFRGTTKLEDAVESFSGRLSALGTATDLITANNWSDAYVGDIVERIVRPFRDSGDNAFILGGHNLPIPSRLAIAVGMALHELCTNAVKYGALSTPSGRVRLDWRAEQGELEISWREEGGPAVIAPSRKGFGTRLLERGLFGGAGNVVELAFDPKGLRCVMRARL